VFYLTPQTLVNDLEKGRCDPQDIVLLVIGMSRRSDNDRVIADFDRDPDEAHKGTGDYAYAQVVRYLMATNPHFRVLALTATPGGTPEAVQALVDALHISRIEIRNEDSLDLKQYMHKKVYSCRSQWKALDVDISPDHETAYNPDERGRSGRAGAFGQTHGGRLSTINGRAENDTRLQGPIQQVQRAGLLRGAEAIRLHPYRPQAAMGEVSKRADKGSLAWTYGVLKKLGGLARAMGYLMESSIGMCYTSLRELSDAGTSEKGSKLSKDPNFVKTMHELESRNRDGFPLHPKMVELKNLIIQHFGAQMSDPDAENPEGEGRGHGRGRVMVFAAFREVVEELVEMLNKERPLIRAIKLIGQSTDKQGNAGLNQKGQQEVGES
jgi:ATP-dependent DNA helicase MPH1